MVIAGLTGSIATGKSTVAAILESCGAFIIDADKIAYDVVAKGLPAWQAIINHFGRDVLLENGEINRIYLGDIIFNDPGQKHILNCIVHPEVFKEIQRQQFSIENNHPGAVIILDVPLLIESGMHQSLPEVIVVYVPEEIQIKRLMSRNKFSQAEALSRVRSQMSIEEKKEHATIVIDNSSTIEKTKAQTCEIYRFLKEKYGTSRE